MTTTTNKCFACDKKLGANPKVADTRDGQLVYVGSDCFKRITAAGDEGYQPPKGGPRLYPKIPIQYCGDCNGVGWVKGRIWLRTACKTCGGSGNFQ